MRMRQFWPSLTSVVCIPLIAEMSTREQVVKELHEEVASLVAQRDQLAAELAHVREQACREMQELRRMLAEKELELQAERQANGLQERFLHECIGSHMLICSNPSRMYWFTNAIVHECIGSQLHL